MKNYLPYLLGLLSILWSFSTYASHFAGGSISYENLGATSVRIHSTVYTDCQGSIPISNGWIPIGSGNTPNPNTFFQIVEANNNCFTPPTPLIGWTLSSFVDLTPLCPTALSACDTVGAGPGIFPSGIAEISAYRDYDFSNVTCLSTTFSFSTCCRYSTLTTLNNPGTQGVAVSVEVPHPVLGLRDNSPQLINKPVHLFCDSDTTLLDFSASDPDGDSLSYHLVTALGTISFNRTTGIFTRTPVSYNFLNGYSPSQPLGPNWYVSLDSLNGLLTVGPRAGAGPEEGVFAIEIKSYRFGQYVSSTYYDFPVQTVSCNNNDNPEAGSITILQGANIDPNGVIHMMAGLNAGFSVDFTDVNGDSLMLINELLGYFPSASISTSGRNPMTVTVNWTPDSTFVGQQINAGITVHDDHCPIPGRSYLPLDIVINEICLSASITPSDCSNPTGLIDLRVSGGFPPYTYFWNNGATSQDLSGVGAGIYQVTVTDSLGFTATSAFSVTAGNLQIAGILSSPGCNLSNGSLAVIPSGGAAPYTYSWNTGSTDSSLTNLAAGAYTIGITDAVGCFNTETFILKENDSCTIWLSGRVLADIDTSCTFSAADSGLANILVLSSQGYGTLTDSLGYYRLEVDTGAFTLTANGVGIPSVCVTPTYSLNFPSVGVDTSGLDFLRDLNTSKNLRISGRSWPFVVAGVATMNLMVENLGLSPADGYLSFQYDTALTFLSSYPPISLHDTTNRELRVGFNNLQAGGSTQFSLVFAVDTLVPLNTTLTNYATAYPVVGDSNPLDNNMVIWGSALNSYDPNDKLVSPVGLANPGYILRSDSLHTYTIRFQNVGNYPARTVVIVDSLDPSLDITSLRMAEHSHPFELKVFPGNVLEFTFNDINLADSASNPIGSQGLVSFRIQHDPSMPIGTQLTNKADIYFDFNPPIRTNTVLNTLIDAPAVKIQAENNQEVCEGDTLLSSTQNGVPPYRYSWTPHGGNEAQVVIGEESFYVIEIEDSIGLKAIDSIQLDVAHLPLIEVSYNIHPNSEVSFSTTTSNTTSFAWFVDGNLVSTDPNPTIFGNGRHVLVVILEVSNRCGTVSIEQSVILSNIEDKFGLEKVEIFPHPVTDQSLIQFDNPQGEKVLFELFDLRGKRLRKASVVGGRITLERTGLPAGLYVFSLRKRNGEVFLGKVMVE